MSRTTSIVIGTVVVILGLLMVAVSLGGESGLTHGAEGSNSRTLFLGGAIAFGGVIRLMSAFSMDGRVHRAHPADPSDPRWHGGAHEKQIAGRPCVECGRKITVAAEGVACDVCSEPAHTKCCDQHRTHAHRPDGIGPFR